MGLTVALSNALSGMKVGQSGLDVLSRNVANSGTPGYHRQSMSIIDTLGINSPYARSGMLTRAFNQSLQQHYTSAASDNGFAAVRSTVLDRLQTALGKPGSVGSLDTAFGDLQSALSALATSPDDYATRAQTVAQAQAMALRLNDLSGDVQTLRRDAEGKIATSVDDLNQMLSTLQKTNTRLADSSIDLKSRATLLDQRDRLVSEIAQTVDIRVDYRTDGTVALTTRSGVGLFDNQAAIFEFQSAGTITATSQFDRDPEQSNVGKLTLRTQGGLVIDLVRQDVVTSGTLGGLIDLRDRTLVAAQDQLDEIATALAQAMSTVETSGTAATAGPADGFDLDIASIRNGNTFDLDYTQGGVAHKLRVVRVDDTSQLPMDRIDADGTRLVGLDFSGGAAGVASQLQAVLGSGLVVSNPSGTVLRVVDDGVANNTDVTGLSSRTTASVTQGGGLALSLFVDAGNTDFTNSLDGFGQKRGFAARIGVNSAVVADNKLLVQYAAGGSLGDDDRAVFLGERLDSMQFFTGASTGTSFRMAGTVDDLINQTINFQGNAAAAAIGDNEAQVLTMETLNQRLDSEYGVDVDEEMARLMELQNAFAANARVVSVVQELLDVLMQA